MFLTVREPKWSKENSEIEKAHPEWDLTEKTKDKRSRLPKPVLRSMIFLLMSVALWYFAYNALTTWFTSLAKATRSSIGKGYKPLPIREKST
jgi:hypothetical protein